MPVSKDLMWTAVSSVVAVGAGLITRKALTAGWERARGQAPPSEEHDPDASWGEAIVWAAAIGAAVGVARVVSRRSAAAVWEKTVGEPVGGTAED